MNGFRGFAILPWWDRRPCLPTKMAGIQPVVRCLVLDPHPGILTNARPSFLRVAPNVFQLCRKVSFVSNDSIEVLAFLFQTNRSRRSIPNRSVDCSHLCRRARRRRPTKAKEDNRREKTAASLRSRFTGAFDRSLKLLQASACGQKG